MLNWAVLFYILALVTALFGVIGVGIGTTFMVNIFFGIFIVLFLGSLAVPKFKRSAV